jgi:hypothetical protein
MRIVKIDQKNAIATPEKDPYIGHVRNDRVLVQVIREREKTVNK